MLDGSARRFPHQLRLTVIVSLMVSAGLSQDMTQPYYSIKHPRVLAMIGGSAGDAGNARQALAYALTSVNYPVTFIDDAKLIDSHALSQFELFIQFGPVRLAPAQEQALADFVNNGGGFLALHDALDGPRGGAYEKLIGGSLERHAGPYRMWIHVTDVGRKSPLTSGVRDFEVLEEQIFPVYAVDTPAQGLAGSPPPNAPQAGGAPPVPARGGGAGRGGQAHGLITGYAMDNTSDPERLKLRTNQITNPIAGWWQEMGKGRVCYFSIGNTIAGMNHPMMQKLYENAFRWLTREN